MKGATLDKVVRKGLSDQTVIEYIPEESEGTNHNIWKQNIQALKNSNKEVLMWEDAWNV